MNHKTDKELIELFERIEFKETKDSYIIRYNYGNIENNYSEDDTTQCFEIYKNDGTIYCQLSDENEKPFDIPWIVFAIRDMLVDAKKVVDIDELEVNN